ncbi:hypothetical protein NDU88_003366 [Pleurodeles waltl]|uniref:Uncharacterized protein n=1 Tax=Pleurodeles waltl TaxID=8319 RepID=A0AAV7QEP8_PLEWA|nr:hypothetical protein NDU88_003366 [Pleurodeles waltl]
MAARPQEPRNHSGSDRATASLSGAYSSPLWCQSSSCRYQPRSWSTAASLLLQHPQPGSALRLTPRRRLQSAEADLLPECTAAMPSFRLDCGPESPRTRPRPAAATALLRLSTTGASAGPSSAQAAPDVRASGARLHQRRGPPLLGLHSAPNPGPRHRSGGCRGGPGHPPGPPLPHSTAWGMPGSRHCPQRPSPRPRYSKSPPLFVGPPAQLTGISCGFFPCGAPLTREAAQRCLRTARRPPPPWQEQSDPRASPAGPGSRPRAASPDTHPGHPQ